MRESLLASLSRRVICIALIMSLMSATTVHAQLDAAEARADFIRGMLIQVALSAAGRSDLSSAAAELISIGLALPRLALCILVIYVRAKEREVLTEDASNAIANDPRADELGRAYRRLSTATVGLCAGSQVYPEEILTSNDPNDKVGSQGTGAQQYISGDTPLRYAIFFSNKETANAPAQDVIITDQLDLVNDDLSTLSLNQTAGDWYTA
jgi:hypothetical protein